MTRAEILALVATLERDPDLAARIARVLAPHVFRAGVSATQTVTYSTRAGGAPPGYAREPWRAVAHKIGVRRGRHWYISAEQLAAYEQRDSKPANDAPLASTWTPKKAAEALGLRPVGGAR